MKVFIFYFTLLCIGVSTSIAQDFRFGKVSKEELAEKHHPKDPEADAAILYREYDTDFEYSEAKGWQVVTNYFERIKIYSKNGFDYATNTIRLYHSGTGNKELVSGLKGVTYNLDGNSVKKDKLRNDGIFETEESEYWDKKQFTLPNVKEGSVLEIQYRKTTPFVEYIDPYVFQELIPVNNIDFRFSVPEYFGYKMHQKGWVPFQINNDKNLRTMTYTYTEQADPGMGGGNATPKTRTTNVDFKENVYKVTIKDLPAVKKEKYSGALNRYLSALTMELQYTKFPNSTMDYYTTSWEAVSKSIYESSSFGGELNRSGYFEDAVDALITGVTDEQEKVKILFDYVKNKMHWNNSGGIYTSNGTKNAFKKETGNAADINLMLTAILRYAGLNANPVLVSTKKNGVALFPTKQGFNYVIAGVEISGKPLLMDATLKEGEVNLLNPNLVNGQGRLIREDGNSIWIPLKIMKPALHSVLVTAALEEDLTITGTSQNRFTGNRALTYRVAFTDVSKEDVNKTLEKNNEATEISNATFKNLKTYYKPVALSYDFESINSIEEIGDKIYVSPLLFFSEKENPFKSSHRDYPIDFEFPIKDRYLVNISMPDGYRVETLPESVSLKLADGSSAFTYQITQTENILQVAMEKEINKALFPAESYEELKEFFQRIVDKTQEKVVLTKI
ncbi:transglutaminase domain-containing protein [Cochleicola gelatinilyticus]|uniref:Transglutaminase-like domain-containing protein n=1 Tax=Cochleicola gelatinilyticus TaxID=1763537 RepID=A0A167EZJ3_9FLAO|nr:DUF3857 domain-containing protein [Cochleicola gelatinilyticus]OAB76039.1 hypothetical protein ULVI_13325 [Cochleicola gelatinilyticus]